MAPWTPTTAPPPKRTFTVVDDQGRDHQVTGLGTDDETRCVHHDAPEDVVAFRAPCCTTTWPCHRCHEACSSHTPEPWPETAGDEPAVLCGACHAALTISAYLLSSSACPACDHAFNPGCRAHHDRYFAVAGPRPV